MATLSDRFDELLAQSGYVDVHASRYAQTGYVLKAHRFFTVKDDFPRIREVELRTGVGEVRYTIQLGACTPFLVPDKAVTDLLREGT